LKHVEQFCATIVKSPVPAAALLSTSKHEGVTSDIVMKSTSRQSGNVPLLSHRASCTITQSHPFLDTILALSFIIAHKMDPDLSVLAYLPLIEELTIIDKCSRSVDPIPCLRALEGWIRVRRQQGRTFKSVDIRSPRDDVRVFVERMSAEGLALSVSWIPGIYVEQDEQDEDEEDEEDA
jgi:hypothetical protein